MRYVRTLQKQAAAAGRKAEIDAWLGELDPETGDLDTLRAAIIEKILSFGG
jgi:hypothetical protein